MRRARSRRAVLLLHNAVPVPSQLFGCCGFTKRKVYEPVGFHQFFLDYATLKEIFGPFGSAKKSWLGCFYSSRWLGRSSCSWIWRMAGLVAGSFPSRLRQMVVHINLNPTCTLPVKFKFWRQCTKINEKKFYRAN